MKSCRLVFVALLWAQALALAFCAVSSQFFTEQEFEGHFAKFKNEFDRTYPTTTEEQYRRQVFADNLEFIIRSNLEAHAGRRSYLVAVNNFTDLTNGEFRRLRNGFKSTGSTNNRRALSSAKVHFWNSVTDLPNQVDWVAEGVVTPVKDQGQCGSCWAFSAVASIEGQQALHSGLVSLSEQNLIDCSGAQGNMGCNGGLMDNAFEYVQQNEGIDTEESYPYEMRQGTCRYSSENVGATISNHVDVVSGDEGALQNAVASIGPISVAIDASQSSFQFYSSGVYNEPNCSPVTLDHGVTAVGYGTQNGVDYWKVKNSWGTSWGTGGYILMSRNKQNQCGIATSASYPVI